MKGPNDSASTPKSSRHLPKHSTYKGSKGGGRRLVRRDHTLEISGGGTPTRGPTWRSASSPRLRSSHSMTIPDRQDLVVRMRCCAAFDWFTEEKGRVEMRSICLRGVVTYSLFAEEVCFASAAAAAASFAEVQAWATYQGTGFARSSAMVRRPRSSAEDAISTREGTTCLFALTAVTSGSCPRSSEELELLNSVGASARVLPVASVVSREMPVSSLPAAPLRRASPLPPKSPPPPAPCLSSSEELQLPAP